MRHRVAYTRHAFTRLAYTRLLVQYVTSVGITVEQAPPFWGAEEVYLKTDLMIVCLLDTRNV